GGQLRDHVGVVGRVGGGRAGRLGGGGGGGGGGGRGGEPAGDLRGRHGGAHRAGRDGGRAEVSRRIPAALRAHWARRGCRNGTFPTYRPRHDRHRCPRTRPGEHRPSARPAGLPAAQGLRRRPRPGERGRRGRRRLRVAPGGGRGRRDGRAGVRGHVADRQHVGVARPGDAHRLHVPGPPPRDARPPARVLRTHRGGDGRPVVGPGGPPPDGGGGGGPHPPPARPRPHPVRLHPPHTLPGGSVGTGGGRGTGRAGLLGGLETFRRSADCRNGPAPAG